MWEVRIVMELCRRGCLRTLLNARRLEGQDAQCAAPCLVTALSLARDIACGMAHIHSCHVSAAPAPLAAAGCPARNAVLSATAAPEHALRVPGWVPQIIHGDLKTNNVLLVDSHSPDDGVPLMAKVTATPCVAMAAAPAWPGRRGSAGAPPDHPHPPCAFPRWRTLGCRCC